MIKRIAITPGEPAGIGPDLVLAIAQQDWPVQIIVVADPQLMQQRAEQLGITVNINQYDEKKPIKAHLAGNLTLLPVNLAEPCIPGLLNVANGHYVVETLRIASEKKYKWGIRCGSYRTGT